MHKGITPATLHTLSIAIAPSIASALSKAVPLAMTLALSIALTFSGCVTGPTTIEGIAYVNNSPCPNARIELRGAGDTVEAYADAKGHYVFKNVAPGTYKLQIVLANGSFNIGQDTEIKVRGGRRTVDLKE